MSTGRMDKDELAVCEGMVIAACGHPSPSSEVEACLGGLRDELARASEAKNDAEIERLRAEVAALGANCGTVPCNACPKCCDQKDVVIKALADALWDARQYGDEAGDVCWCMAPCAGQAWRNPKCEGKEATLRLAGRLP